MLGLIVGHRGTGITNRPYIESLKITDRLPENTILSFEEALIQGADGVECDVCLSKDGHIVVIHDDELNRNVLGADREATDLGHVFEKSLNQLKKYDVGLNQKIPSFFELLNLINQYDTIGEKRRGLKLSVEIKGKGVAHPLAKLINQVVDKNYAPLEMFEVHSFKDADLKEFISVAPSMKIGLGIKTKDLFEKEDLGEHFSVKEGAEYKKGALLKIKERMQALNCKQMRVCNRDIKPEIIDFCLKNNFDLTVWFWEENRATKENLDKAWLKNCIELKSAGAKLDILTDFPHEAREGLERVVSGKDDISPNGELRISPRVFTIFACLPEDKSSPLFLVRNQPTEKLGFGNEELCKELPENIINLIRGRIRAGLNLDECATKFLGIKSEVEVENPLYNNNISGFLEQSQLIMNFTKPYRMPAFNKIETKDSHKKLTYAAFATVVIMDEKNFKELESFFNKNLNVEELKGNKDSAFKISDIEKLKEQTILLQSLIKKHNLKNNNKELADYISSYVNTSNHQIKYISNLLKYVQTIYNEMEGTKLDNEDIIAKKTAKELGCEIIKTLALTNQTAAARY